MRPGLSDMYERLRSEYRARTRNSDNVADVFTFETLESVVDDLPEQFRHDSSDNELMMTVYRNEEARKVFNSVSMVSLTGQIFGTSHDRSPKRPVKTG